VPKPNPSMLTRRNFLEHGATGAAALTAAGFPFARAATATAARAPANPLATESQRRIEDTAVRLLQHPEMVKVRDIVRLLWDSATRYTISDQADRLEQAIDDHMFHHAMRAANHDANNPEVAWFMTPPHRWFGRDVPGSRWGGDSPDFYYRNIPISHGGKVEILGRPTCKRPPYVFWSLMGENTARPETLALLETRDIVHESDGSFRITLDGDPANGRPNHIQTKPGADFVMIRDAIGDWQTQTANALTVRRLDPAGRNPTEDDMARHAAKIAYDGLYYAYFITQTKNTVAPNSIRKPISSAAFGGVPTQYSVGGSFEIEPDEAVIMRCNAAGAGFRNVVIEDLFMITPDYATHTSSLNMDQMVPDDGGDFTIVVGGSDPGIHNWLDTTGLRRTIVGTRWQAFPRGVEHDEPWITTELVKLDDLEKMLPSAAVRISTAGRRSQLAERLAGYRSRFRET